MRPLAIGQGESFNRSLLEIQGHGGISGGVSDLNILHTTAKREAAQQDSAAIPEETGKRRSRGLRDGYAIHTERRHCDDGKIVWQEPVGIVAVVRLIQRSYHRRQNVRAIQVSKDLQAAIRDETLQVRIIIMVVIR